VSNLTLCGFLDCFDLVASLRDKANLFKPVEAGEHVFPIRWDDGGTWKRTRLWQKWAELRNVVSRIQRRGSEVVGPLDLGRIFFEMVPAGVTLPWRSEGGGYWDHHMRLHLPLRTNPAAFLHFATEMHHLLPGTLHIVNVTAQHAATNAGEWPRVHLVVDLRRKEVAPVTPCALVGERGE
jgi:hypothetical protein